MLVKKIDDGNTNEQLLRDKSIIVTRFISKQKQVIVVLMLNVLVFSNELYLSVK